MSEEALKSAIVDAPALVLDDPDVMRALLDAAGGGGRNVVDLRSALVSRLETRLAEAETARRSVIAAAYEALAGAAQVHRAVLILIEAEGLGALMQALLVDCREILAVDAAALCIETAPEAIPDLPPEARAHVVAAPDGAIAAYLSLDDAPERDGVTLRACPAEADLLFGSAPVRSEALIQLDLGRAGRAMLALGAEEADRFGPEHGVDLVLFFKDATERLMRRALAERA